MKLEDIKKVGVVGAGTMGFGIAINFALWGYPTIMSDLSDKILQESIKRVKSAMALFIEEGLINRKQADDTVSNITTTTDLAELADKSDFITETITERAEDKRELFNKLDEIDEMDISLPEKIQLMFSWKQEYVSNISDIFIEEILTIHMEHFDMEEYRKRFVQFIVGAQKRGEVRPEIRPEFFIAVLDKLQELAFDEELIRKYPNFIEFNREIKDFLWFGLYARPDLETK